MAIVRGTDNDNMNLQGTNGQDTMLGRGGDDNLSGGAGGDLLLGGGGDDRIDGGAGSDRLFGGDGSNTFVFTAGSDRDTVYDFTSGEDTLAFQGFGDLEAVLAAAEETRSGLRFDFGGGDSLLVIGLDEISAGDIDILMV